MLFRMAVLERVMRGEVTLAFRRWSRPTVKAGGTLRTAMGVLAIDAVEPVGTVDAEDAARAGYASLDALIVELGAREGQLYRIAFHVTGEDPRLALRERDGLDADEVAELKARLAKLGDWAERALAMIGSKEGIPAVELAVALGFGKPALKARIRKLKELGLTESLMVGYRLSPRGRALLTELGR